MHQNGEGIDSHQGAQAVFHTSACQLGYLKHMFLKKLLVSFYFLLTSLGIFQENKTKRANKQPNEQTKITQVARHGVTC